MDECWIFIKVSGAWYSRGPMGFDQATKEHDDMRQAGNDVYLTTSNEPPDTDPYNE